MLSSSLKYLIEGTIDPGLINHAQRCSDRYGDVIHLSRALVNTQQNIDLDIYDDCDLFENTNQRSASQQGPKDQQIILYPNPVSTQLVVEFGKEFSGNIQIMSMDGKVLRNRNHSKIFKTEIDIALGSGLYLLKTISKDGEIRTNKFLVSN